MENFNLETEVGDKGIKAIRALEAQVQEIRDQGSFPATSLESFSRILLKRQIGGLQLLAIACGGSSAEQLQ